MATYQMLAWMPGPMEMVIICIFGLLIFGKRLPEVGKSLGKSIVEFKKGLNGIEDQINNQAEMLPPPAPKTETRSEPDNTIPRTD